MNDMSRYDVDYDNGSLDKREDGDFVYYDDHLAAMEALREAKDREIERLKRYVKHERTCATNVRPGYSGQIVQDCTCGLTEVLGEME